MVEIDWNSFHDQPTQGSRLERDASPSKKLLKWLLVQCTSWFNLWSIKATTDKSCTNKRLSIRPQFLAIDEDMEKIFVPSFKFQLSDSDVKWTGKWSRVTAYKLAQDFIKKRPYSSLMVKDFLSLLLKTRTNTRKINPDLIIPQKNVVNFIWSFIVPSLLISAQSLESTNAKCYAWKAGKWHMAKPSWKPVTIS